MERAKIQVFNSGVLDIWEDQVDGTVAVQLQNVPFEIRTVGSKRAFEAEQAGHLISRMVRIPVVPGDWNARFVVIGGMRYGVVQVQEILDTSPRCLQVTLDVPNMGWTQRS